MKFSSVLTLAVLAAALPLSVGGCQQISDAQNAACCSDPIKIGAGLDAKASGQFFATLDGVDALAGVASATVSDVANACRAIAADLGASATELDAGDKAITIDETAKAHCNLASAKITKALAGTTLTLAFAPPKCEASFSAKASCEGRCDVQAKCDVNVTPVTCTGGELVVECDGDCTVKPGTVSMECSGRCDASCSGSCTAEANVAVTCDGVCHGTCSADANAGPGIQADGTCKGKCSGTCDLRAGAKATCEGHCNGSCTGSCKATATSPKVQCSGACSATATPLECKGGTMSGGCNAKADCQASCDASVQAHAQCTPPDLKVTGGANLAPLLATLEKNLPVLITVVQAQSKAIANAATSVETSVANLGNLDPSVAGCVVSYAIKAGNAGTHVKAALSGATSVTVAAGVK